MEDGYDQIHQKTWARRTAGLLGGATLGGIYGAIIGAAAAFIPYVFGAIGVAGAASVGLPLIGAVAASAGLFAVIGGGLGLAIGADVGANAGSNAITTSIELNRLGDGKAPVLAPREPSKPPALYVWKAAPVLIPLFAAVGALVATIPAFAPLVTTLGFKGAVAATAIAAAQPATAAAIAASASVFGMLGALMPFKNSLFHNKLTNFYYDLISDKKWSEEAAVQPLREMVRTVDTPYVDEPQRARSFVDNERRYTLLEHGERADSQTLLSR